MTRAVAPFFALLLVLSAAKSVHAQTVSLSTSLVTHTLNGQDYTRPSQYNPTGINYQDCEKNVTLNFELTTGGPVSGYQLEAWAGQNCTNDDARTEGVGTATATCWPLFPNQGSLSVSQAFTVSIPVQTILSGQAAINSGDITGRGNYSVGSEATSCHVQSGSGPIPLDVWFIWVQESVAVTGSGASVDVNINADLLAATPPTINSVLSGDGLLKVNWTSVTDPDILGFNVYYLPSNAAPSDASVTVTDDASAQDAAPVTTIVCNDAGFSDGGVDEAGNPIEVANPTTCHQVVTPTIDASSSSTTSTNGGTCSDPFPVGYIQGSTNTTTTTDDAGNTVTVVNDAGEITSTGTTTDDGGAAYGSGSISPEVLQLNGAGGYPFTSFQSNTATNGQISGLTDGISYSVGIATIDAYGNVGAISSTLCGTPAPILDFWDVYRADGGQAGGGYCSVDNVGEPAGAATFGIAAVFVAFGLTRKKKRRLS